MSHRVLIVDDHEPWRRHVASLLDKTRGWKVIGEASNGCDAVPAAAALRPDLILLDVELPRMNGIKAAERITTVAPETRILFMSAHSSLDIVEAALNAGGLGYIQKMNAGNELLPAMAAIMSGGRFVGAVLTGQPLGEDASEWPPRCHEAAFYAGEGLLVDGFADFAKASLTSGASLILVAPAARRQQIDQRLEADGIDIAKAIGEGRYRQADVAPVLAEFMVDGWPDEARFWKAGTAMVLEAAKASKQSIRRVAACGECAPTLLREGRGDAAVRLEQLWDALVRSFRVDVFCGYTTPAPGADLDDLLQRIRREHSHIHS